MNDIRSARPSYRRGMPAPFDGDPWALCKAVDPDLFFLPHGLRGRARTVREEEAKAVCQDCPLREDCAEWALANPASAAYGVFGGLTEKDRTIIRKGAAT